MLPALLLGATFLLHHSGSMTSLRSSRLQENRPLTKLRHLVGTEQGAQKSVKVSSSNYIYNGDGHTPLMLACDTADIEQVKLLLSKSVAVNVKNKNGATALMLAAKANYMNYGQNPAPTEAYNHVVALLLQHGADVEATDKLKNTALTYAALGGNLMSIKLLIAKGASVNSTNANGVTMLHAATLSGNLETIKFFIALGANVNAVDNHGDTPLLLTDSWTTSLDVFKLLIDNGADIKARNSDGETLLMKVCSDSGSDSMMQAVQLGKATFLIDKGINIDAKSDLSLASQKFNSSLGGFGVDRSMATSGKTALMFAVHEHNPKIVNLLLAHGANVNLTDEEGQTALIHACRAENQDIAMLLLDSKADPNSVDNAGMTALMVATQSDNLELVRALMAKGADANFKNDDDKTSDNYIVPGGKIDKALKSIEAQAKQKNDAKNTKTPPVDDGNDTTPK